MKTENANKTFDNYCFLNWCKWYFHVIIRQFLGGLPISLIQSHYLYNEIYTLDYFCVDNPGVNSLRPSDAYMHQWSDHHWFRYCLGAWSAPSHYLNQCWNIVNPNKIRWNLKWNSYIFVQENVFEIVICEMAVILSPPQCVNGSQMHILCLCKNRKIETTVSESICFPYPLLFSEALWAPTLHSQLTRWIPRSVTRNNRRHRL